MTHLQQLSVIVVQINNDKMIKELKMKKVYKWKNTKKFD